MVKLCGDTEEAGYPEDEDERVVQTPEYQSFGLQRQRSLFASVAESHANLPGQMSRTFSNPVKSLQSFKESYTRPLPNPTFSPDDGASDRNSNQNKMCAVCFCCIVLAAIIAFGPML